MINSINWIGSSFNSSASNTTLPSSSTGFFLLLGSSFFYGTNLLPVKKYETGDGMFFQLILSMAVSVVGFIVYCIRGFPKFYAFPMYGGVLWAVIIIRGFIV
jgi:hypothetical protein